MHQNIATMQTSRNIVWHMLITDSIMRHSLFVLVSENAGGRFPHVTVSPPADSFLSLHLPSLRLLWLLLLLLRLRRKTMLRVFNTLPITLVHDERRASEQTRRKFVSAMRSLLLHFRPDFGQHVSQVARNRCHDAFHQRFQLPDFLARFQVVKQFACFLALSLIPQTDGS